MQHTDRENDPQYNAPRLALALSDFLLLRRLGDGSYSTVVLAEHRQTGIAAPPVMDRCRWSCSLGGQGSL